MSRTPPTLPFRLKEREERQGERQRRQQQEVESLANQHRQRMLQEEDRLAMLRDHMERETKRSQQLHQETEARLKR